MRLKALFYSEQSKQLMILLTIIQKKNRFPDKIKIFVTHPYSILFDRLIMNKLFLNFCHFLTLSLKSDSFHILGDPEIYQYSWWSQFEESKPYLQHAFRFWQYWNIDGTLFWEACMCAHILYNFIWVIICLICTSNKMVSRVNLGLIPRGSLEKFQNSPYVVRAFLKIFQWKKGLLIPNHSRLPCHCLFSNRVSQLNVMNHIIMYVIALTVVLSKWLDT